MNNRVRALESLVAVFLLGLVIGMGGALLWVDRSSQNAAVTAPRFGTGFKKNPIKLAELLHLTPEQDAKVKAIFEETRRQSAALSKEMGPKFEDIRNQANSKIAELLNDEQKKLWEEFLRQRDETRNRSARGDEREGGGPQLGPNPSGPQQSQPPGLGEPQLGPGPTGPEQQRRGGPFQGPNRSGSQSLPPGEAGQNRDQRSS
jgi:hypothetical protein